MLLEVGIVGFGSKVKRCFIWREYPPPSVLWIRLFCGQNDDISPGFHIFTTKSSLKEILATATSTTP